MQAMGAGQVRGTSIWGQALAPAHTGYQYLIADWRGTGIARNKVRARLERHQCCISTSVKHSIALLKLIRV